MSTPATNHPNRVGAVVEIAPGPSSIVKAGRYEVIEAQDAAGLYRCRREGSRFAVRLDFDRIVACRGAVRVVR